MDCPVCQNALITLELAEVEIDHCIECDGIWLDGGELEILIGDKDKARRTIGSLVLAPRSEEHLYRCPLCDKKMEKVVVDSTPPFQVIDRCPRGEGLWFDQGELKQILAGAGLAPDSKVMAVLADMFGLNEC
jgi:Zn-finger nucleic acid-binding protein